MRLSVRKICDFVLLSIVFVLLSIFIRPQKGQQKKIIGFASRRFTGNVKYLYLEMVKYPDLRVFFVTDEKDIERLSEKGIDVRYYLDAKSAPLFLRTNAWVTSHGPYFIPFVGVVRKSISSFRWKHGSKWIDIWHGIGFKDVTREKMLRDYDLGIATSTFLKKHYSRKDRHVEAKLRITGFPRNDPLVNNRWSREKIEEEVGIRMAGKNLLYAVTWGHRRRKKLFPWGATSAFLEEIEKVCDENNCNFLIRMHPKWYRRNFGQWKLLEHKMKYLKRVFDVSPYKYADAQRVLYISDVLITDWSSIVNDFILLDRPLIFLDTPSPVVRFVLTPEDRVGYVVKSKDEFFEKLCESVTYPNLFKEKRRKVLEKIYNYIDGNSSKRCIKEILSLL